MIKNYLLPEVLYKLKPFIYIGLGIYVWVKLDTIYAVFSGILLIGAGLLALLMRQSFGYHKSRMRMQLKDRQSDDYQDYEDSVHDTVQ